MRTEDRSEEAEMIEEAIENGFQKALPDNTDLGPSKCAICGENLHNQEAINPTIPIQLPPATKQYMTNPEAIGSSGEVISLRLRFCSEHWDALVARTREPEAISFNSFNGRYIMVETVSEQEEVFSNTSTADDRWDQDRLRVARMHVEESPEKMEFEEVDSFDGLHDMLDENEQQREVLEATLLVAAVDGYGLNYGSLERSKDDLVAELRNIGYEAERLRNPWFDVEIRLSDADNKIVGTAFDITEDDVLKKELTKWEVGPERVVRNTVYCWLERKNFTDTAKTDHPEAQYVGFYRLPGDDTWRWVPFPENYSTNPGSDHRAYLPISGPTEMIPALPLREISAETITPEGFEKQMDERWEKIDQNRSMVDRARDELWRRLQG
ncbi:hypothetical protein ACOZ4N_01240 (plasmid) [Halorientalis pallida]|uniref:hypothetical protein n=1 Tax=Halorientalis pallida TaxID=2479928 RepID=UPI003C6EA5A8